ncbi:uncharacterized protein BP5553_00610 [Venustampulla echinocandica]|uniref:TPR-like protein n=1 Tax=Venustampulla echinocandica TaxID=2656787 RepID=A0A370TYP5_9HELO|nr:uncharacterized protein BP5553_00610 [Venustampulla echinocandica]RDL40631.1 hypothetical protein BP5553_00610 [Venustampulla echinocandica]
MMPKPKLKQFLKENKKKSKHAPQRPTTADEYLAGKWYEKAKEAGVDFEEAGEKWRGGDAVKSARFFVRAIDCYNEGLGKFPTSFDLAYNKARVQYELSQHPRLLAQLPGNLWELLQTALESSRYALTLNQTDADVLFNTAQILTSLAEGLHRQHSVGNEDSDQAARAYLEEALDLFQRCFELQTSQYGEFQAQLAASANPGSEASTGPEVQSSEDQQAQGAANDQEERWVTVTSPVSKETLRETVLAQLETLTSLCDVCKDDKLMYIIEQYAEPIITERLAVLVDGTDRELEAAIARAAYTCAVADAKFRLGYPGTDIRTYVANVQAAWQPLDLNDHVEGLGKRADALGTCSISVRLSREGDTVEAGTLRWTILSQALQDLTAASKFPDDVNMGQINLLRGDMELMRSRLGLPPLNLDVAVKNQRVLVKNAEKYYRGAKGLTASEGPPTDDNIEATVKEALAKALSGDSALLVQVRGEFPTAEGILAEAFEEGLFTPDQIDQDDTMDLGGGVSI